MSHKGCKQPISALLREQIPTGFHSTGRSHEAHKGRQFPLFSGKSRLPWPAAVPGSPGYPNIKQHFLQLVVPYFFRLITDNVAYQSFGYRGVYSIHGHLVSVVSGPAQSQLRKAPPFLPQAPLSYWQYPLKSGCVPSPGHYKSNIFLLGVMPNILKVVHYCPGDVYSL